MRSKFKLCGRCKNLFPSLCVMSLWIILLISGCSTSKFAMGDPQSGPGTGLQATREKLIVRSIAIEKLGPEWKAVPTSKSYSTSFDYNMVADSGNAYYHAAQHRNGGKNIHTAINSSYKISPASLTTIEEAFDIRGIMKHKVYDITVLSAEVSLPDFKKYMSLNNYSTVNDPLWSKMLASYSREFIRPILHETRLYTEQIRTLGGESGVINYLWFQSDTVQKGMFYVWVSRGVVYMNYYEAARENIPAKALSRTQEQFFRILHSSNVSPPIQTLRFLDKP